MRLIARNQFVETLRGLRGSTPIGLSAIVKVDAVKKDRITKAPNPYAEIFKLSKINAFVGIDYENSVNLQREREGNESNFVAKPRVWGVKVAPSLVEHKGKYFISCKVEKTRKPIYLIKDENNSFKVIRKELVAPFLPLESHSSTQDLEREVIIRTYSIDNLHQVNMNKETIRFAE